MPYADEEFQPYQEFVTIAAAAGLVQLLEAHGIAFQTHQSTVLPADTVGFTFNEAGQRLVVRLLPQDFARVTQLREASFEAGLDEVSPDHYLFSFSDEELVDILAKPDEWSPFDYVLARKLLRERGLEFSQPEADALRAQRATALAEPARVSRWMLGMAYFSAVFGGVLAIVFGWFLHAHYRTLPDGRRSYIYAPADRYHGLRLMVLGAVGVLVAVAMRIVGWR